MPCDPCSQAVILERVTLAVRRIWFGAQEVPLGGASCVVESGGKMVMLGDTAPSRVDELLTWASERSAYVVITSCSRPADLRHHLERFGFQPVQRRAVHLWSEPTPESSPAERRWSRWLRQPAGALRIVTTGLEELPVWNAVCWRSFGRHGTELASLAEKQQAFAGMAKSARWYLALIDGRPAGTAILYQHRDAAQIMAVGTLPAYRGRGVATAVMERLIADWQNEGDGPLFLDTTPGSNAERLYRRLGFARVYTREVFGPPRRKRLFSGIGDS